jgi:hypothetical protein
MSFDLADELPPVIFTLNIEDAERFESFMRECEQIKNAALEAEDEPVQVSPLEFVAMVMEKEHLIGKPIVWAEWPNKEKNT